MKPSSLATVILRFIALYFIVSGLFGVLSQIFISAAFSSTSMPTFSSQMPGGMSFSGVFGIHLAITILCVFFGFVLYANSRPLGRFIGKGLE